MRGHGMVQLRSSQQLPPPFNEPRASIFPQPMPVQSRVLWGCNFIPHAMPGEFETFFFPSYSFLPSPPFILFNLIPRYLGYLVTRVHQESGEAVQG